MKKCCFIIPYFGKLPSHFEVFLKTCSYNINYEWLIITDDKSNYLLPNNVKIIYKDFLDLKNEVQSKFDFKISLEQPYKLCDYKPAYGYIFEDYIKDFKFWGHCDIDTIMGYLDDFITEDMLSYYDKIFCLGHMILYKNTYENNRMFMKEMDGRFLYKESFSTNNITAFDETYFKDNINAIFLYYNKNVYMKDLSFNIKALPTKFTKITFDYKQRKFITEEYRECVYYWKEGKIYRSYMKDDKLITEEFMYMHFQNRNMKYHKKILNENIFKIVPNKFLELEYSNVTKDNFKKIQKKYFCAQYLILNYKWKKKTLKKKINNILNKK